MEKLEIEILDSIINCSVIKLPERKFPGIVIQGDSLWILYNSIRELRKRYEEKDSVETLGLISELLEQLSAYLRHYEAALESHNIERPYHGTINDLVL